MKTILKGWAVCIAGLCAGVLLSTFANADAEPTRAQWVAHFAREFKYSDVPPETMYEEMLIRRLLRRFERRFNFRDMPSLTGELEEDTVRVVPVDRLTAASGGVSPPPAPSAAVQPPGLAPHDSLSRSTGSMPSGVASATVQPPVSDLRDSLSRSAGWAPSGVAADDSSFQRQSDALSGLRSPSRSDTSQASRATPAPSPVEPQVQRIKVRSVSPQGRDFVTASNGDYSDAQRRALREDLRRMFRLIPSQVRTSFEIKQVTLHGASATAEMSCVFRSVAFHTPESLRLASLPPMSLTVRLRKVGEGWLITDLKGLTETMTRGLSSR